MALRYKLYGGAQRPDAITGLAPDFAARLEALYNAAPPEVQAELGLNSAYRSVARQKELWDQSDKSGRMVARPGQSHHNKGDAVDLWGFGLGNKVDLASQGTRDWVVANLAKYGLERPMSYEPWHVQPMANFAGGAGEAGADGNPPPAAAPAASWTIDPKWPAGMRNNNPGNIKYVGQPGTHASANTDQGDPQAVYDSPQAGMRAMYELLQKKYAAGKLTANDIIAAQGGWTPGNTQAAMNIAKSAGLDVNADIGLSDPAKAQAFMRALMLQEHGAASSAYTDQMIADAISGKASPTPETAAPGGGVRHPPNPRVGSMDDARTLIASGQMAPVPQAQDDEPPAWGKKIADAIGGMNSPFGGGGGGGWGQVPKLPTPTATPGQPMPIAAPSPMDEDRRNRLAALMQQYWIG